MQREGGTGESYRREAGGVSDEGRGTRDEGRGQRGSGGAGEGDEFGEGGGRAVGAGGEDHRCLRAGVGEGDEGDAGAAEVADAGGDEADADAGGNEAEDRLVFGGFGADLGAEAGAEADRDQLVVKGGGEVAREEDEGMARQRADRRAPPAREWVIVRHGDDEGLAQQRLDVQRRVDDGAADERDVDAALFERG